MGDKVFINGMAAVHAGSSAQGMAMPDVCLCPPSPPAGPIPTPLPNIFKAADLTSGASTVTIEGNPVGNMNSYIQKSTGNAVSRPTGGGVISHAVEGAAYPVMGSFDVFIESSPALKVFDLWTANHMPGAKMPPNTPPAPLMGAMSVPAMAPKTATKDMSKGKKDKKSWVRFLVVDKQGLPVAWVKYAAKFPDGRIAEGRTPPGGTVEVRGFAKGQVELTFVDFDAAKEDKVKAGDKTGGAPKPCAVSKADKAYQPGQALSLAADREHKIELPIQPSFWLQLQATAKDAATMEDEYVLESDDGAYQVRRSVSRDHVRGAAARALEFPSIYEGPLYSLTHQPAGDFPPYVVFSGRTFTTLLQSSRWLKGSRRKQ
jgi:hypothetical protein